VTGTAAAAGPADTGRFATTVYWTGVIIAVIHLYFNLLGTFPELWVSAIHFAGFALMTALMIPPTGTASARRPEPGRVIDLLPGIAALLCAVYLILSEDALYARGVKFSIWDWVFSLTAVLVALELTRRTTGWFIPCLILASLSYVFWWGAYIDGMFGFAGLSLETVMFRSYFSPDGMFGQIAMISWTFVFMFILFGAFLVKSGGGDFIIELARASADRFTGGPGFVAIAGSGIMGSISGSSVANTASTGVITIPLMQKAGFPARFAAGIEAAASTGGQLMPPIMGAGVFIMSAYTQIPYLDIIAIAALPALLYFFSVAFHVRITAKRSHAQTLEHTSRPIKQVLLEGWHYLLPVIVLVGLLIYGYTPTYAAAVAILAVILSSWFSASPMKLRDILDALAQGSQNMATTAILLVAIGLVVNVVAMTGIGNTFSLMITEWAGGNLLITLILVALASLVLGMGLPVTAAYIVLATLSAPALYNLIAESHLVEIVAGGTLPEQAKAVFTLLEPDNPAVLSASMPVPEAAALVARIPLELKGRVLQMAIDPAALSMMLLSAHMIIFWLSQDSNVTPPVCLTAFTAAAIARTPPMATGFTAWKIAKGLYIIPLLFAYTGFIGGSPGEVLTVFFFALFGLYAFTGFIEGYLEGPLNLPLRLICGGCAVMLLWPHETIWFYLVGFSIFILFLLYSRQSGSVAF